MNPKILIFISFLVLNLNAAAQTKALPKSVADRTKVLGVVNVGGKSGAWHETVSRQGGFKIWFPAAPVAPRPPEKVLQALPPINSGSYYLQHPAVYYNISFREHSYKGNEPDKLKEIYDLERDKFLEGGYFELVSERDVKLGERHLGRERVTRTDEGLSVNKTWVVLINGMFYELNTIVPQKRLAAQTANIDKFLNSFQLTAAPPEKPVLVDYKTIAWRELVSPEAEFRAEFPGGSPTRFPFPDKRGVKPNTLMFRQLSAGSEFVVSVTNYHYVIEDLATLNAAYDNMTEFFTEKPKYQLTNTKSVASGKYPGREIAVQDEEGEVCARARIFVVGKRLYQLIVSTPDYGIENKEFNEFNEKNIERFFNSFKFTGTALSVEEMAARPLPKGFEGELDDEGVYQNEFFGFSIVLPDGWQTLNSDEIGAAAEAGKLARGSSDAAQNAALDAAYKRSIPLVTVSKNPFGTPENAMIWLMAEKAVNPALTALDAARASQISFAERASSAKILRSAQAIRFGGVDFAALEVETESYGTKVRQKLLFTKRKGYDLTFIFAHAKETDTIELDAALKSLKFTILK